MAKTRAYDSAEHLDSPQAIAAYLSEALETGDPSFVVHAIGTALRARGMSDIGRVTSGSRAKISTARSVETPSRNSKPS